MPLDGIDDDAVIVDNDGNVDAVVDRFTGNCNDGVMGNTVVASSFVPAIATKLLFELSIVSACSC